MWGDSPFWTGPLATKDGAKEEQEKVGADCAVGESNRTPPPRPKMQPVAASWMKKEEEAIDESIVKDSDDEFVDAKMSQTPLPRRKLLTFERPEKNKVP